jgi:hypothetical protein
MHRLAAPSRWHDGDGKLKHTHHLTYWGVQT